MPVPCSEFQAIGSPWDMIEFCKKYDLDWDDCPEDYLIYSEYDFNEYIIDYLQNISSNENWVDVLRYLEALPQGCDYYLYDETYGEFDEFDLDAYLSDLEWWIKNNVGFDMGDDEDEDDVICVDTDAMMDLWKGEAA